MPVYWFALFAAPEIHVQNALLAFFILHFLVYPASNGYNSYIDRDTTSIGGLEHPQMPTRQLLTATIVLNAVAIALSLFIGLAFTIGIIVYILASLAYSSRQIRLKKYPVTGYLTVIVCQGALVFYLVYAAVAARGTHVPLSGLVAAALLIGGFYPLTQVYQHQADAADGVKTMSMLLGYRGTFLFAGIIYALAFAALCALFFDRGWMEYFLILMAFMLPVMLYFGSWLQKVFRDVRYADFKHTMRMTLLASLCANAAFVTLLILKI